jgi:hypothetical protein
MKFGLCMSDQCYLLVLEVKSVCFWVHESFESLSDMYRSFLRFSQCNTSVSRLSNFSFLSLPFGYIGVGCVMIDVGQLEQ